MVPQAMANGLFLVSVELMHGIPPVRIQSYFKLNNIKRYACFVAGGQISVCANARYAQPRADQDCSANGWQ